MTHHRRGKGKNAQSISCIVTRPVVQAPAHIMHHNTGMRVVRILVRNICEVSSSTKEKISASDLQPCSHKIFQTPVQIHHAKKRAKVDPARAAPVDTVRASKDCDVESLDSVTLS